jgi:hypothetical protein
MTQGPDFSRQGRTEPIYDATTERVTYNNRLGALPHTYEAPTINPSKEPGFANTPKPLDNVEDLIKNIFG